MGRLHRGDVGSNEVDSRSRLWSGPGLGMDPRGMVRSLQITVGETDPVTGQARVYSDMDCVNPAEGALPWLVHGIPIAFRRIGRFLGIGR